jgi:hypothetical protein
MLRIIIFSALLMTLSACVPSDINEYFPKVTMMSAKVLPDGRVSVVGKLERNGEEEVRFLGACYSNKPQFDILENQRLTYTLLADNTFEIIYEDNFKFDSTYYFRVWASNRYGYVYGDKTLSLSKIAATPIVPPCSLSSNTFSIANNTYYSVTSVSQSVFFKTTSFTVRGFTTATGLTFAFGSTVKTGVYTTVSQSSPEVQGTVNVSCFPNGGAVNEGNKVYVTQSSNGVFEFTLCNGIWNPNGGTSTQAMNAKFKYPY